MSDVEDDLRRALYNANHYAGRTARQALNAARPHAVRWAPPQGSHFNGIYVKPATIRSPWMRSHAPNRSSRLSHIPRWALIAWRRGRPVLMLVQFCCGQSSMHARGEQEPSGAECKQCLLLSGRATICKKPTAKPLTFTPREIAYLKKIRAERGDEL